ncbi:MAG: hypothetical protein K6T31_02925 [Alicyclobacillus sp.]|nr:hypothetical protein [Alicyclobacillus sp.]
MMFRQHGWRWGVGAVLWALLCGCGSGQGGGGAVPGHQVNTAAVATPAGHAVNQNAAGSRPTAGTAAANAAGGSGTSAGNPTGTAETGTGTGTGASGPGSGASGAAGGVHNLQVSHATATFDGLVETHVQAVVAGPVTAIRVYNESTHTLLGTFAPKDGKVDLALIGAKAGNVLTLTPFSGAQVGQAVQVTVQ